MEKQKFGLVIHAGAENKSRQEIGDQESAFRQGIEMALAAGWDILNGGGTAIAAVEAAVRVLEDNPLFNAGRGGAYAQDGVITFDAALMDGHTLQAGAVAYVKQVKNPISLARAVMDHTDHVLLVGEGAEQLARERQLEFREASYFETSKQEKELEEALEEKTEKARVMKDTVGAVALDKAGNLAAATSTGGLAGQYPGRVGDSPIIGGGTYAHNKACAISCTGDGESILKACVAHEVAALMKYQGLSIQEAAKQACTQYKAQIPGDRNLIGLTKQGEVALQFETALMFRGLKLSDGRFQVAIWADED